MNPNILPGSLRGVIACIICVAFLVITVAAASSHNRDYVYAAVCADHLHAIGQRFPAYIEESGGLYPPSYVYPFDADGNYDLQNQNINHPFGVAHWSWLAFKNAPVPDEIFQCPAMRSGGLPRLNPGPRLAEWENGQVNQDNNPYPSDLVDKQAPRLAYAANAAIIPRGVFTTASSSGPRMSALVSPTSILHPSSTALLTEFFDNWKTTAYYSGGALGSKSHWPINPFYNIGSGLDPFAADFSAPGFIYGIPDDQVTYGSLPTKELHNAVGIITGYAGVIGTNDAGRHHPGGDKYYDGTANFLFIDGSQRRMSIWQSVQDRLWGDRFYSITGNNIVLN